MLPFTVTINCQDRRHFQLSAHTLLLHIHICLSGKHAFFVGILLTKTRNSVQQAWLPAIFAALRVILPRSAKKRNTVIRTHSVNGRNQTPELCKCRISLLLSSCEHQPLRLPYPILLPVLFMVHARKPQMQVRTHASWVSLLLIISASTSIKYDFVSFVL